MSDLNAQQYKDKLLAHGLDEIARCGWQDFSLLNVAQASGEPIERVMDVFACKTDVLIAFGRFLDVGVADNIAPLREDETCRDRLFDILMERYELLNEHRGVVLALFDDICFEPKLALTSLPHLCQSMELMLGLAQIETNGVRGAARLLGVCGLYVRGVARLVKDDSADLTKVMAGLDQDLGHLERAANFIAL